MPLRTILHHKPFSSFTSTRFLTTTARMGSLCSPFHWRRLETWGFPVLRTDYSNDPLFTSFIGTFQTLFHEQLDEMGADYRMEPYLVWSIVEDREVLDGADLDATKKYFKRWVQAQLEGEGDLEKDSLKPRAHEDAPRYNYGLLVNKHVLEELKK
ncbi:hypothetical protein B0T10DRAFT_502040 [Thelonectria olida]|uniref:Uncharacterized protein n=1 Tax=Thelonectria olida TaxID=1576542 RepID=A0A9P9AJD3_9HYPO|nr:hypothetical protein B0T10DRAFT_502040 [Thelonectria olida]